MKQTINGKNYIIKSHIPKHMCGGCAFFDTEDGCNMLDEEELKCGHGTIYELEQPQIKPIDEHVWSDRDIFNPSTNLGVFSFDAVNPDGFGVPVELSVDDLSVIANALGYKLTKIGGDE